MHFGYTIVYVPDVEAAVSFYERAFGFRKRFNADDWDYAELESGDTTLAFAAEKMADLLGFSITPNRADGTAAGIELAFVTEDVAEDFRRATDAGAAAVTDPHQTPWGQTVSYVRDLNGVLVEICSPVGG
jgi:lactoylglutathione lyase